MKIVVNSKSEKDTFNVGKMIAQKLTGGEVIIFEGDLGAGKTVFSKGLAEGLGVKDIVTSPTFTILNIYQGEKLNLYHFDMYRLTDADEARELGFEEYIKNPNGVCAIEWAEQTKQLLPEKVYKVVIEKVNDDERTITILFWG